jgi:membrane protein
MSILQFILITGIILVITFVIKFLPLVSNYSISLVKMLKISQYEYIKNILNIVIIIDQNISEFISFTVMFLFLSYIYYLIPNKKQRFIHTFVGTFNTMILWWLSTNAFQYYIVVFPQINLVYGSIAGIIIALLYFYICSVIFIYGAELNYWSYMVFFNRDTISNGKTDSK